MADIDAELVAGARVAGRYRIESLIAKGGMGAVYVATDDASGARIALKRRTGTRPREARMFEREYHTLRGLRHPRIIDVHDYGVADGAAYYTMELLDGQDLRKLAPLPFRRAARYLRDVASSLALLHARRLVHRDLSPSNVRVTSDDRCKLIDFGVLASFGVAEVVAGTPPLVPPEALSGAPLDQRSDLYALGALAYWLLTGRHAYPAKSTEALRDLWQAPPQPPSRVCRDLHPALNAEPLPAALDTLVLALLDRNPMARPASAAEVIARLSVIAELPPDSEPLAAESYLVSAQTVGREAERKRLIQRTQATIDGTGSSLVIEAESGLGSSRLLAELAIDGQLRGALPLLIDGKLVRGAYGAVQDLIARLLEAAPELALTTVRPYAAALVPISAELRERFGAETSRSTKAPPGELRMRAQVALAEWLWAVAEQRPLMLLIDNAQRLDEASGALISSLAHEAAQHRVMLVSVLKTAEAETAPAIAKSLLDVSAHMALHPLGKAQVEALVLGLFGEVPHVNRLAERMYRATAGNPEACIELVRQLVQHGVIRHNEGEWSLPRDIEASELFAPGQSQTHIVGALSLHARQLGQLLSVHSGPLALEVCLAIGERAQLVGIFGALDELTERGVLARSGTHYHFAHDGVRKALYTALTAAEQQSLHRVVGNELAARSDNDVQTMLDAGFHLLQGGDEGRGAELLAAAGLLLGYDSDEMGAAIPPLRAALAVFRKQGRPPYELAKLLGPLCNASWYCDRRLAREYGDETVEVLSDLIGLSLAKRLRPWLGKHASLYLGLGYSALAFTFGRGRQGIRGLRELIVMYCNCVLSLGGVAATCLDAEAGKLWASRLEHLTALGRDHAGTIAHRFAELLALAPLDRPAVAVAGCRALLARLESKTPVRDLPDDSKLIILGGIQYEIGALSSFADDSGALAAADALDRVGLQLYALAADQVRASYYACRGEIELADFYRDRVDMHAVRAGSGWQAEVWAPASAIVASMASWDMIGLKRACEELEGLSEEIPSLRRHAMIARAAWLVMRGDAKGSIALFEAVLEGTPPRAFAGWSPVLAIYARARYMLGQYDEAKRLCERALAEMCDGDEVFRVMYEPISAELALAEAQLGDLERASGRIAALLDLHRDDTNPTSRASLHYVSAQIALLARDSLLALRHAVEMERAVKATENPALLQQCGVLRAQIAAFERNTSVPPPDEDHEATNLLSTDPNGIDRSSSRRRLDQALRMIIEEAGGVSGFLFANVRGELSLLAPEDEQAPPEHLLDQLKRDLRTFERARRRATTDAAAVQVTALTMHTQVEGTSATRASPTRTRPRAHDYRTVILTIDGERVDGVVAVLAGSEPRAVDQALARAIAVNLVQTGELGDARATAPRGHGRA